MDVKKDTPPNNSPTKKDRQSPAHSRRKSTELGRSRSRSRNRKKKEEEIRNSSDDYETLAGDVPDASGYHSDTDDAGNNDDISEINAPHEEHSPTTPNKDTERSVSRLKRTLSGKLRGSSNKVESGPPPVDDSIHKALTQTITPKQFSKLIRRIAHIDQTNSKGQSLLHLCSSRGLLECMRILLKKGANANLQDSMGYTPLHCAAVERKLDSCKLLIESKNIDVTISTNEQANVLHYLVRTPVDETNLVLYRNVLDLLIDKGIDVNEGNKHNEAPIHFACMKSNVQTVAFLLERGADCNLKTALNETPLHYAIRAGSIKLVRMLMESGADPTAQSIDDNTTPVDVAEQYQCTDILDCLQSIIEEELVPDLNSSIMSPRVRLNEATIVKESSLDVFWQNDWTTFFIQLNKQRIICKEKKEDLRTVFAMHLSRCAVMAEEGTIMSDSGEQLWCFSITAVTGSIISYATTIPEERELWIDAIQGVIDERKNLSKVYEKLKAQSKPRKKLRLKERNLGVDNCLNGIKKLLESADATTMCEFIVKEPELASAALWKVMSMEKESIFVSLVKYLLHMNTFEVFLKSAISHEIRTSAVGETLFREMSLCTRMLSCYLDMEPGKEYLRSTVLTLLNDISSSTTQDNLENIAALSQKFLDHILSSPNRCPFLFRELMRHTRERVDKVYPNMTHAVVGGFVFLRFICPAIISPHKFGLSKTPNHVSKDAVLITKLLQTVSNGVEFDESREGTLQQLNPFIRRNRLFVDVFFDSLTDPISIEKQRSSYVPPKKLSTEEVDRLEQVIYEHMGQYRARMNDLLNDKIRICMPFADEFDDSEDEHSGVEVDIE